MSKEYIGIDVLTASKKRVAYVFDKFEKISVSFSGGKDSSVMTHLVCAEARKRSRKIALLFIDLEAQYENTIDHVVEVYKEYKDVIEPYWVALPIVLSNSVSVYEPRWICWEPDKRDAWVRDLNILSINDQKYFPFYRYAMEFEEFTPAFGEWYSENGKYKTACFVGIRSDESLNRYRTIKNIKKGMFNSIQWTTKVSTNLYNVYPIYDWKTEDIWTYSTKFKKSYNKIYELMTKAGLSLSQQRLCQPYGYDQRKGLWLFHVLESETWTKIVARVNGANSGAEFVKYSGNISGQIKITKPDGHTWQSFCRLLLNSMPEKLAEHYDDKIFTFIAWWVNRGNYFDERGNLIPIRDFIIPDEVYQKLESGKKAPSWRRICKCLLRNDYWCKGLSFSQTNSASYQKYKARKKAEKRKYIYGVIPWNNIIG